MIIESVVIGGGRVDILCFLSEKTGQFPKHSFFLFFVGAFGEFIGEGGAFVDESLHVFKSYFFVGEVAFEEGIYEIFLDFAEVGVFFCEDGYLFVGVC